MGIILKSAASIFTLSIKSLLMTVEILIKSVLFFPGHVFICLYRFFLDNMVSLSIAWESVR